MAAIPVNPVGGGTVRVCVRGITVACWRCHRPTTVVVGLHLAGATDDYDLVQCNDEHVLRAALRLLESTGRVGLSRPIKPRYSRTAGAAYLSNGCQYCDALMGNFFIFHEELPEVLAIGGLEALDHLAEVGMPADEWDRLAEAAAMWD